MKMSGPYQESNHKTSKPEPRHYNDYVILAPHSVSQTSIFGRHLDECQMINTTIPTSPLSWEAIY
jgi:hypothetical protein